MKVLMIYPHPDSEKGISAYSSNLINNIKKQGQEIDGITFIQGKPLSLFKQIDLLKKYDIVHIQHEYNLLGWYGLPFFMLYPLLYLSGCKVVTTMHTLLSQHEKFEGSRIKTFLRKVLYLIQNRWINWFSDKIVVHANFFKEILRKEYGVPGNKLEILPHAIIEGIKTISKSSAKKQLKLSGPVYLLIGTMVPDHGHDIIIRQADQIGKTILVVTNPSAVNYRNEDKIKDFLELNEKIVKDNQFGKFVRFDLGKITYEKWWKYFAASDLILLPYRGGIGSGIFADAMAMQKPVIASDVPYFRDFAKSYGCLRIAKTDKDFPKEIKESMIPRNYKKMIKEAERYFAENNLTAISKKYRILYSSLN